MAYMHINIYIHTHFSKPLSRCIVWIPSNGSKLHQCQLEFQGSTCDLDRYQGATSNCWCLDHIAVLRLAFLGHFPCTRIKGTGSHVDSLSLIVVFICFLRLNDISTIFHNLKSKVPPRQTLPTHRLMVSARTHTRLEMDPWSDPMGTESQCDKPSFQSIKETQRT